MTTLTSALHVALDRQVWTYEVEGHPAGVITGYERDGGAVLEHLIVFPGAPASALMAMIAEAVADAWQRGYAFILFAIRDDHPLHDRLMRLAFDTRCEVYASDEQATYFIMRRAL